MKPFDIFICHKKSSGKDFADHLKAGLEELGYHAFLDSKDIPKMTDGIEEWIDIRDQALKEAKTFILIITPGFDLSSEVRKELKMAREVGDKKFLYFRHRDLGRRIVVNLENEKLDLGRQEQVSFENKEELLRLAVGILKKEVGELGSLSIEKSKISQLSTVSNKPRRTPESTTQTTIAESKKQLTCEMCSKPIEGQPYVEIIKDKSLTFHCKDCAQTYKRFKRIYGDGFK